MKSKRTFIVFTVLLAFLLVLSGCSQNLASNNQKNTNANGARLGNGSRMPDFGQPDRQADIRGIVKSIIGNEATILKVDVMGGRGGITASSTGMASASGTRTAPVISLNSGNRGDVPGGAGQGGRGFGGPGAGSSTDRATMLAKLKEMSTGEEKVLIPVGIQMLKSVTDTSAKKRTMVEATISDITADKTITIWLNSGVTDKKVAEFVLIN